MPAQVPQARPSTAPVHIGQTLGVTPNPNATRPATVAAIGNPYGGMNGAGVRPTACVGSTGFGNGTQSRIEHGRVGKVASAGIPGHHGHVDGSLGNVASAGIPAHDRCRRPAHHAVPATVTQPSKVLSKPPSAVHHRGPAVEGAG